MHKQHLKKPTLQIQARATIGVGKPQADSECNERIPPDGFDMAAPEVTLPYPLSGAVMQKPTLFRQAMWASPPTY